MNSPHEPDYPPSDCDECENYEWDCEEYKIQELEAKLMEMKRAKAEKDKREKLQNSIGKLRNEAIETLQKMIEGHRDLIKQLETHIEQVRNGECDETIIQNAEKKPEQKFTNAGIKSKKEPAVRKRSKRTIIDRDATRDMLPHGFVLRAKCANGEIMG